MISSVNTLQLNTGKPVHNIFKFLLLNIFICLNYYTTVLKTFSNKLFVINKVFIHIRVFIIWKVSQSVTNSKVFSTNGKVYNGKLWNYVSNFSWSNLNDTVVKMFFT